MSKSKEYYYRRKEEVRRRREETLLVKKVKAMLSGKKVFYVTCPLCGLNKPMIQWGKKITPFQIKPDYFIIQCRKGGGRGIGFFLVPEESTKIEDLPKKYPEIWENLKQNVYKLYEIIKNIDQKYGGK